MCLSLQVVIGKTDCLLDRVLCDSEHVKGFPSLVFYRTGLGVNSVEGVRYLGERDTASMDLFIKESLNLQIEVNQTVEAEGHLNIEDGVYVLTAGTFQEVVAQGDTFVQLCPSWSPPCHHLANTWADLATSLAKAARYYRHSRSFSDM